MARTNPSESGHNAATGEQKEEAPMSASGRYVLAEQCGSAGFYAEVTVGLDVADGDAGLTISNPEGLSRDWRLGVAFGLAYAWEHLPPTKVVGKHYSATVSSVKGHAVDTTLMALAFAAAKAFWMAAGCDGPNGFTLDAGARSFCVPK